MEARPITDRIMMSDVLKGTVTDVQEAQEPTFLLAILEFDAPSTTPLVGSTVSFMLENTVELAVTVLLTEALPIVKSWPDVRVKSVQLHLAEVIAFEGNSYIVDGLAIESIDAQRGMCVLAMKLRHGTYLARQENTMEDEDKTGTCPDCGGTGELHRGSMDAGMSDGGTEDCARCNGTGNAPTVEASQFDKFMDSILVTEARKPAVPWDSPQRERARRRQERPLGRIRFVGGAK